MIDRRGEVYVKRWAQEHLYVVVERVADDGDGLLPIAFEPYGWFMLCLTGAEDVRVHENLLQNPLRFKRFA